MKKLYILSFIAFVCDTMVQAQTVLYNDSETIFLSNGALLYVNGNLVNEGTVHNNGKIVTQGVLDNSNGAIINNDTLVISNEFINTNTYSDILSSTVQLKGSTPKINSSANLSYANLAIDASSDAIVEGKVSIRNNLNMQNGFVKVLSGSDTLFVDSTATINANASTYIKGALYRRGTIAISFPIGDNSAYRPSALIDLQNTSPNQVVGMEVVSITPNAAPTTNIVYDTRGWKVHEVKGDFTGAKVQLTFGADDSIGNSFDTLVVAESNLANGNFQSIGASSITGIPVSGTITAELPYRGQPYYALASSANVKVRLKAWLQGVYNRTLDSMPVLSTWQDTLNKQFNAITGLNSQKMYVGYSAPITAVDKIDISLRATPTGTDLQTVPAFLMSDGSIRDFYTGTQNFVTFARVNDGNYYVVINHRNHLSVMSSAIQSLDKAVPPITNMTTISNIYAGGAVFVDNSPLSVGLIAGDILQDKLVNANDLYKVQTDELDLLQGYTESDITVNGVINAADRDLVSRNSNLLYFSTVP